MTIMLWKCLSTKTPDMAHKIAEESLDHASAAARMIDPDVNAFQPYDEKYDGGV